MTSPDFRLDLCGESCPYPVIHTLEALQRLDRGDLIEIVTDCPQAYRNIPDEAVAAGSRLVGEPVREGARMYFLIEAGDPEGAHHLASQQRESVPGKAKRRWNPFSRNR